MLAAKFLHSGSAVTPGGAALSGDVAVAQTPTLDGRLLQATFTLGKSPWRLTFKQALAPFHTRENLPAELRPYLRQQYRTRVDAFDPCVLTAAITLGHICASVQPAAAALSPHAAAIPPRARRHRAGMNRCEPA